jgi:hypothetical protein
MFIFAERKKKQSTAHTVNKAGIHNKIKSKEDKCTIEYLYSTYIGVTIKPKKKKQRQI